ncbi:MAG: hypothetical protein R2697_08410 [Ilumatobacteraceae bacterium]
MTMHLSPTSSDPERYLERTGKRPAVHLHDLGVLGEQLLLGHGVWLDDDEVDLVIDTKTAIAYCPWAYLRLGQGVCAHGRHAEIVERGGRVVPAATPRTPATRSTSCGPPPWPPASPVTPPSTPPASAPTRHSSWQRSPVRRRSAWPTGSARSRSASRPTSWSTAPTPRAGPRGDVGLQLVWGTDGRSVRDVWVAGRHVVTDGRPTAIDHDELAEMATHRQAKLLERAGIEVPHLWPHRDAR